MNLHTSFILFIFDLINKYYHLNRIHFFLKKRKIKIFTYFDIGAHLGSFADVILSIQNLNKYKYLTMESLKKKK